MNALRAIGPPVGRAQDSGFEGFYQQEYGRSLRLAWLLTRSDTYVVDTATGQLMSETEDGYTATYISQGPAASAPAATPQTDPTC